MICEVCIDSVEGALSAQAGGAQRVELCADLVEGGVTPSLGMIRQVRQNVSIRVNVIIRPRGGDFCYTPQEFAVMQEDIRAAGEAGADGVVIGLLLPDGRVDIARTGALVALAQPMQVTFHRAFDLCSDPFAALDDLSRIGITRILTSGGKPTAVEGADCIAAYVARAGGRISIMAGGGITAENVAGIIHATGVHEVHFSARQTMESQMIYRVPEVWMGKAYQPDEYHRKVTSAGLVRQVVEAASGGSN